jgi:hypothetical protein
LNAIPQFYWLWAPVCFETFGTVFDVNEYADGQRWHESGAMLVGDDTIRHAHRIDYKYHYEAGTRRSEKFEVTYTFSTETAHLEFTPITHFQMVGLGYLSADWGHGNWKGELETGGDRFLVPVETPMDIQHLHTQTLSHVTCTLSDGTKNKGIGILETLVLGAHSPSGFTGMVDGFTPQ